MKRIACALAGVAMLPCLMGATCVLTQISNPAPPANLREDGTFTLAGQETFDHVKGYAERTVFPEYLGIAIATIPAPGTWRAEMSVGPGNYNCWGKLYYAVPGNPPQTKSSGVINGNFL